MKKALALFVCFAWLLCMTASAKTLTLSEGNISVTVPGEFIAVTQDNVSDYADAATSLGFTVKSLKSHMKDNGILVLLLTGNNTCQVQLRVSEGSEDSFAEKIGDFSMLTDQALAQSASELVKAMTDTTVDECSIVENSNSIKAIELITATKESSVWQYITVRNGDIYSLVCYDSPDSDGIAVRKMFDSLNIKQETFGFTVGDGAQIVTAAIILPLIGGAVFLIIRLIMSFVHDFRNRENDVSDYIKIKRRKF